MHARLISTPLVIAALGLPAVAAAKTPKFSFKKPSIVPGQSIGGVSVGMTKHKATALWGAPDRCLKFENVIWCQYLTTQSIGSGGGTTSVPFAGFYLSGSKLVGVEIGLPTPNFAVVKKLKTPKGVGLGSSAAKVRAKYHIPTPSPGEATASRNNLKQGGRCTSFYAPEAPFTTITGITVGICGSVVDLQF